MQARPAIPVHKHSPKAGHTEGMALLFPLAHVGHWLWVLYLPPILIVVGSLVRSTIKERRRRDED